MGFRTWKTSLEHAFHKEPGNRRLPRAQLFPRVSSPLVFPPPPPPFFGVVFCVPLGKKRPNSRAQLRLLFVTSYTIFSQVSQGAADRSGRGGIAFGARGNGTGQCQTPVVLGGKISIKEISFRVFWAPFVKATLFALQLVCGDSFSLWFREDLLRAASRVLTVHCQARQTS